MSDAATLGTLVTVNPRFTRSVSLIRDFDSPDALKGYIVTPIGRDLLHRLAVSASWRVVNPHLVDHGPLGRQVRLRPASRSAFLRRTQDS